MTPEIIEEYFTYHAPTDEQIEKLTVVRTFAKALAHTINDNVPECADKTAAIRKLRECVMTANAAIVLEGKV
jgi:hypothetical protein